MDGLKNLAAAKIKAMASMSKLLRDAQGQRSKYATLASVLDTVRAPYGDAGIAIFEGVNVLDDVVTVEVTLMHAESGESITHQLSLPGGTTAQTVGSAITYGRRYLLMTVCGIAPEDDDGEEASVHGARQAPARQNGNGQHRQARQPVSNGYNAGNLVADARQWSLNGEETASPAMYGYLASTIDKLTEEGAHNAILSHLSGYEVNKDNRPGQYMAGVLLNKLLEQTKDRKTKEYIDNPKFDPSTVDAIRGIWVILQEEGPFVDEPAPEPA